MKDHHRIYFNIAKIILGAGLIGIILWKLPIIEMLWMFAFLVMIPVMFFVSIGLMGQGTYDIIRRGASGFRERVDSALKNLEKEIEEPDTTANAS